MCFCFFPSGGMRSFFPQIISKPYYAYSIRRGTAHLSVFMASTCKEIDFLQTRSGLLKDKHFWFHFNTAMLAWHNSWNSRLVTSLQKTFW